MHIENGPDLNERLAVLRGRMAGYHRVGKTAQYLTARDEMLLLKAQRIQEVVVDMLKQVTEGYDVSVERTLEHAKRVLLGLMEVTGDDPH